MPRKKGTRGVFIAGRSYRLGASLVSVKIKASSIHGKRQTEKTVFDLIPKIKEKDLDNGQ